MMTIINWSGFILASLAVVLAPGPGSIFVARSSASGGFGAGISAMLGIMIGDFCLIILSLAGVAALFTAYPALFHTIRIIGAGYLIFLGIQAFRHQPEEQPQKEIPKDLPLKRAIAITLLNPKAVFFFMAFFPIFIESTDKGLALPYALMTTVFMLISLFYLLILSGISSKLGSAFNQNRSLQKISRRICGCIFIGFGIKVASSH